VDDQSAVHIESDPLGNVAFIVVDTSVYAEVDIFKAAYWFTDKYYLFLSRDNEKKKRMQIEIRLKKESDACHLVDVCREFYNSLIDYQVRRSVLIETGSIRDALLHKAFGEGGNHFDPDKLGSDESQLPRPGQTFLEDNLNIGHPTGAE